MSTKKIKITMSCHVANLTCDKTQYKAATFWEKIKLKIHLITCTVCRRYSKNNSKLTKSIETSKVVCLDKKERETLKKDFDKALKNHLN